MRKIDNPETRSSYLITIEIVSVGVADTNTLAGERLFRSTVRNTNVALRRREFVFQRTSVLFVGDAVQLGRLVKLATVKSKEKVFVPISVSHSVLTRYFELDDFLISLPPLKTRQARNMQPGS